MHVIATPVIGICAAALLAPLAPLAPAAVAASGPAEPPGSTQSLSLTPLKPTGRRAPDSRAGGTAAGPVGLPASEVSVFSMVGVVWSDPEAELHGRVLVRARAHASGRWSGWQDLQVHSDAPDPRSGESAAGAQRGGTAPLWVGDSDGVQVRVLPESGTRDAGAALPEGLAAELVDPGAASGAPEAPAGPGAEAEAEADRLVRALPAAARPFVGPRPRIISRRGWGANERLRERRLKYTKTVNIAFVHHSASGNGYSCSQAPAVLRSIYRYHVRSQGWADLGYNFAVDKCGRIYEGRAGGVAKPVMGAHTYGFNHNSMGIAVLGSFGSQAPPRAAVDAVSRLTAWKLGLYGKDPRGRQLKVSGGGLYKKGRKVSLRVISGHRDGFATECPGGMLYSRLGVARTNSAHYQGRP